MTGAADTVIPEKASEAMTDSNTIHATDPARKPERGRRDPLRGGLPLGRWGGIPVSAQWTALFTLALFAEIPALAAHRAFQIRSHQTRLPRVGSDPLGRV